MDVSQFVKRLWEVYILSNDQEEIGELLDTTDENITVIGTGKHEFYECREEFVTALAKEERERQEIAFHIQSLWTREMKIDEDVSLVYGGLHVTGVGREEDIMVDMDTRYSVVLRRRGDTWKVLHIHQSLPYGDQHEGEYYPKTLLDQVEEANRRAEQMERLARTDQMTGLLNHFAFYEESERLLREKGMGCCMAIDLDDFKQVNDSYGHLEGDAVLQEVGKILGRAAGPEGVAGRIGGDEFALFCGNLTSGEEACAIAGEILAQVNRRISDGTKAFPGISIGISMVRAGESLKEAFRQADTMLYEVKRGGKNGYRFYGPAYSGICRPSKSTE